MHALQKTHGSVQCPKCSYFGPSSQTGDSACTICKLCAKCCSSAPCNKQDTVTVCTEVDANDAVRRKFVISPKAEGAIFTSPKGPVLLLSKCGPDGEILRWTFRVQGNSSWSIGVVDEAQKTDDNALFFKGKTGLDSSGLAGGVMQSINMHDESVSVTYDPKTKLATFVIQGETITQQGHFEGRAVLALSTFDGCRVFMARNMATPPSPVPNCLKVGSRVKLSEKYKKYQDAKDGPLSRTDTGTLIEEDGSSKPYRVQADNGKAWWYCKEAIVEASSHETSPTPTQACKDGQRHDFYVDQCRICTSCHFCTGFGKRCINCGGKDRSGQSGQRCGCGGGASGCRKCGKCQRCCESADDPDDSGSSSSHNETSDDEPEEDELQIGDMVQLADAYEIHEDASHGPLKPGDLGVLIEEDGSSIPYKVLPVADGEEEWWYAKGALVKRMVVDGRYHPGRRRRLGKCRAECCDCQRPCKGSCKHEHGLGICLGDCKWTCCGQTGRFGSWPGCKPVPAVGPKNPVPAPAAAFAASKTATSNAATATDVGAASANTGKPGKVGRDHALEGDDLLGHFKSMAQYEREPAPGKPCSDCIRESSAALKFRQAEKMLDQVAKIARSKLSCPQVRGLLQSSSIKSMEEWPMPLAAIVTYTFDLCMMDPHAAQEDNFFFLLNCQLRRRDVPTLQACSGYLYYLFRGLEALPSYTSASGILWRGVGAAGAELVRTNYTLGRPVHWSGFSSASPERKVALGFAGKGGVLLRLRLRKVASRARDVRLLSALPHEEEVLLLPNFAAKVTEEARELDGYETLDMLEELEDEKIFKF